MYRLHYNRGQNRTDTFALVRATLLHITPRMQHSDHFPLASHAGHFGCVTCSLRACSAELGRMPEGISSRHCIT